MTNMLERPSIRLLFLISSPKLAAKAEKLFEVSKLPLQYQFRAEGTATSEMMDALGLGNTDKAVTMSVLPKPHADIMIEKLKSELGLTKPGSGIAFTVAITGGSHQVARMVADPIRQKIQESMEREVEHMTSTITHGLILATVNQGYSEAVMDAAKEAGATGATVVSARRMGGEETMKFWGITVQPEKEILFILASSENKVAIMKAIGEKCGMHSQAQGLVLSLPVDNVVGLPT